MRVCVLVHVLVCIFEVTFARAGVEHGMLCLSTSELARSQTTVMYRAQPSGCQVPNVAKRLSATAVASQLPQSQASPCPHSRPQSVMDSPLPA